MSTRKPNAREAFREVAESDRDSVITTVRRSPRKHETAPPPKKKRNKPVKKTTMPPYKDEHVLIISPGSETTLAQLGLPETFTPARWKFPTRMFPGDKNAEWEPAKVLKVTKTVEKPAAKPNGGADDEMTDVSQSLDSTTLETFEDDLLDSTGAVYPIVAGSIVNFPCLFALLSHIYQTLSPPFHAPVLIIAQPAWSLRDRELLTQFFFESFKIPALAMADAASAALYTYGVDSACIVDVGLDKCDITAVSEFLVQDLGRAAGLKGCGGGDMTRRLLAELEQKGFTEDMCEQLKKSPVCEILAAGVPMPSIRPSATIEAGNPAAQASTGAMESGADAKDADGQRPGQGPRGPGAGTEVGEEGEDGEALDLEEKEAGVLDIASIIAKDNAAEILAKREKEKAEKAAAKRNAADAARQIRLKNSEKEKVTFTYSEIMPMETVQGINGATSNRKRKREVEVGIERFMCAEPPKDCMYGVIDTIAATIHRVIMAVPDFAARAKLWENMVIIGKGSQVRGFKDALMSVLQTRFVVSPSSATMFTSELPSNLSTPLPTNGTNTPVPGQMPSQQLHHSTPHGVNPLLVAATKHAQLQPTPGHLQAPGGQHEHVHHRGYSQGPTAIKSLKIPEYFSDWKDPVTAPEAESMFIGAQTMAKVLFIIDQGSSGSFLSRGQYNDVGPVGVHDVYM